jgi:plastocyanin
MAKKVLLPLSVLLLLVLSACGAPDPTSPSPGATAPGVSAVTGATVSIADMAFQPHTLVAATGATITWQNDDVAAHTVTSSEGWFDSGQLAAGQRFSHQFDQPGTFRYLCNNHPQMEGVVIVLPGGAVAPALFDGQAVEAAFRDSCSGCHGPNREGATGPALIPGRLMSNDDFYFDVIKNSKPGTVMPAWGSAGMSDEEIWALVGYIRSEPSAEAIQCSSTRLPCPTRRPTMATWAT